MGALDAISAAIGELREGMRAADRDREVTRTATNNLSAEMLRLRLDVQELTTAMKEIGPKVQRSWYERTLTIGVLLGIGTTGGVIGSNIKALMSMLSWGGGR